MPSKDYYETLGISRSASADEIKSAFRRLARQYHPDVCKEPGATEKFKGINEAYQTLSNPQKKAHYDRFGSSGPDLGGFGGGNINLEDILQDLAGSAFGDMFEGFFGGGRTRQRYGPQRGDDLRYDLSITLEEAFKGLDKEIEILHLCSCEKCKGTGAEAGSKPKKCGACGGSGQVNHTQRTILGSFVQVAPCAACSGRGEVISNPCKECRGAGRRREKRKIKVHVPAGIDSGYRLRITGEGDCGQSGGMPGDLYVFIDVKPHNRFKRQDDSLITAEKIDFVSATLGDDAKIDVFGDNVELKIPAGTQPNTVIRLRGKGMPRVNSSGRGDLYVEVQVEIPTRLSKEQTDLLKKIKGIK